ncbi:hypothetical protein [Nocardioides marmorisolisilvae]|uniref:Uncharacterized protein n=1 Tax=Nocardioides marmorisolisilvae TaxID=1542737 RepID=A0A3N0DJA1_9ACTN|nr:hypothetical protein [Nocardioides marmorisolisilvae]RNL75496.1 hypothetical protein EFL95_19010 [Nocardioides marmorisolisilvae]
MSGSHRAPDRDGPGGTLPGLLTRRVVSVVERRAARQAERDAADRAAGRAERVPAPRVHRPGRSGIRWYRTGAGQLTIAGCAVVAAILLRTLAPGGADAPGVPLGQGLPHFGADWTTTDGSKYRITVTPLAELSSKPSADGCVPAPADGFVNARFGIRISNFSGRKADVPAIDFGANLDASGVANPTVIDLQPDRSNVAVTPHPGDRCSGAASIRAGGRKQLDDGEVLDLVGVVGGIAIPVQPGVSVIIRYRAASGPTELLAPFPAFPVGS